MISITEREIKEKKCQVTWEVPEKEKAQKSESKEEKKQTPFTLLLIKKK